jgi:hypothetical protein
MLRASSKVDDACPGSTEKRGFGSCRFASDKAGMVIVPGVSATKLILERCGTTSVRRS